MLPAMKKLLVLTLFVLISFMAVSASPAAAAPSTTVVISEAQTRGPGGASEEFVELFNGSDDPVDVTGWRIMYLPAAGGTATTRATLSGSIPARSFVLAAPAAYMPDADYTFSAILADGGGHVLLLNAENVEVDRLGWGTASQPEGVAAPAPTAGQSLRREADPSNPFADTDNNAADFVAGTPDPQSGPLATEPDPDQEEPTGPETPAAPPCNDVLLSEVSASFVELYNPSSDTLPLEGCQLLLDGEAYGFDEGSVLEPGQHLAVPFDSDLSGLGAVILVTDSGDIEVSYPPLADGQAWILLEGAWQLTLQPTPGSANLLVQAQEAEEPEEEEPAPTPDPNPTPPTTPSAPQPPAPAPTRGCKHRPKTHHMPVRPPQPHAKHYSKKPCAPCPAKGKLTHKPAKPKFRH